MPNFPKTIVLTLSLLFYFGGTYAQKNIIKGRLFAFPGRVKVYSLGIGYERMIAENKSIQVLFNRMGYDFRDTDGSANTFKSIVLEYRYYFGRNSKTDLNKSAFLGLFTELASNDYAPSPEIDRTQKYLLSEEQFVLSPGLLIGKNIKVSEACFFDIYFGTKYHFISQKLVYLENNEKTTERSNHQNIGIRIGLNFAYRIN